MTAQTNPVVVRVPVQPVATAGNDLLTPICRSPFAGIVTGCRFIPNAAMTGSATARTCTLYNRSPSGVGTVVVAQRAFTAGVNAVICNDTPVALSGTPANLIVAQGDVLQWESLHVGAGIADPGGIVEVEITPLNGVGGS